MKWIVAPAIALSAAALGFSSAGCGGGGGGGGGGTHTPTVSKNTYSGTVTDQSGDLLSGETILFDGNSTYTTTTNSSGAFTLTVPVSALTGSDFLTVDDSSGTEVAEYPISGSASVSGISITVGPPAPPGSLAVKHH